MTDQIKEINTRLALIDAEQGRIRAMVRNLQQPDGIIGNTSDSPYAVETDYSDPNHYIPKVGEVVEVGANCDNLSPRIFVRYNNGSNDPFECVSNNYEQEYRDDKPYGIYSWRYCRRLNGEIIEFGCDAKQVVPPTPNADNADYLHLLPEGYEFCEEGEADKWVKVEMDPNATTPWQNPIGYLHEHKKKPNLHNLYRPIRPIRYHVAVHEAVTAVPDAYQVDWSKAPEDAVAHAWDEDGAGYWYMIIQSGSSWSYDGMESNLPAPPDFDWKQSKRVRPQ